MKKLLILILPLLFTGIFLHAESLPDISIEGSDAIKKYIAGAKNSEKQQLLKLIEAGDKFAKLFFNGFICYCEPRVECPKFVELMDYPDEESYLNGFCQSPEKQFENNQTVMYLYFIDTDTHIVSISIDVNKRQAVLAYESSLISILKQGNSRNDSEDIIISWDKSKRGKPLTASFIFNTDTNKVISHSKGSQNSGYAPSLKNIKWFLDSELFRAVFINWSEEHIKRQKALVDQIKADLLNYQKTHQQKNIKK